MRNEKLVFSILVMTTGVFYFTTLAPSVLWGDDAYFQRTAFEDTLRPDGGGHWLWLLLAHWVVSIPFGEVAYKANLISAVAGTITIGAVFLSARSLDLSIPASLVVAISLAVAHTFWMHAVRAEVYTVFLALMAIELLLLFLWTEQRIWPMFLAAGLWGTALLGHQMAVLLLPSFAYLLWHRRKWLSVNRHLIAGGLFLVGFLPVMAILQWQIHGSNLIQSLRLYFTHSGVDFSHALFDYSIKSLPRDFALWLAFLLLQFPSPAILLILVTLGKIPKWIVDDKWRMLLFLYVTCVVFAFSYRVNDQYVFYLPSYLALVPFVGLGWDTIILRSRLLHSRYIQILSIIIIAILPPFAYYGLSAAFTRIGINPLQIRELPGREANSYFLWPGKNGYMGASNYGSSLLHSLPMNSTLIADHTPYETLKYIQDVNEIRTDIRLIKIEAGDDLQVILSLVSDKSKLFLADNNVRYYNFTSLAEASLSVYGVAYKLTIKE